MRSKSLLYRSRKKSKKINPNTNKYSEKDKIAFFVFDDFCDRIILKLMRLKIWFGGLMVQLKLTY